MDINRITDPLNRGMVGGLLGIPAEIAAMVTNGGRSIGNLANRLAGVNAPPAPMIENPQFGQEWWGNKMQQGGFVSPRRNALAEFGAGLLDPGSAMTHGPAIAKGLFGLSDPATLKSIGGLLGATMWHGSPHKFDKFDVSKIGTGEGAQAYGHGLYFAESPKVAEHYAKKLALPEVNNTSNNPNGRSVAREIDRIKKEYGENSYGRELIEDHFARLSEPYSPTEEIGNAFFDMVKDGDITFSENIYKSDIPDEFMSTFIDYDNGGRKVLADALKNSGSHDLAAKELFDNGIFGVKYKDGVSREGGADTSNYVLFPGAEKYLKILERNGKPLK